MCPATASSRKSGTLNSKLNCGPVNAVMCLEFTARNEIVLDVGVSCPPAVPKDEPPVSRVGSSDGGAVNASNDRTVSSLGISDSRLTEGKPLVVVERFALVPGTT